MKKIVILILMAFVVNVVAFAQTYQEVVYLRNGSVIRGVIVEQIPNVSLKIQTADGSIFAYQMDEVEKITKELAVTSTKSRNTSAFAANGYKMKSGYRGFVDIGYFYGGSGSVEGDVVALSTTHGYQILPSLFVGAGVGLDFYDIDVTFFADVRGTLPLRSICQPFFDFKAGYNMGYRSNGEEAGFYLNPSLGCRFAISKTCGINMSVGYAMQKQHDWHPYFSHLVSFKVGFDF